MQPEIRTVPVNYTLYGRSLRHDRAKRYGEEIISLLNLVWPVIKSKGIANDGLNRVVFDADDTLFAGIVLTGELSPDTGNLERKTVQLTRYAVWKHVGPYQLLPSVGSAMTKAITGMGLRTGWPMVEVYGHWNNDESKLETETFVAIL
jgi:effector-binding domain-containing protein